MSDRETARSSTTGMRTRWAAIGAAIAITVGAVGTSGSLPIVGADTQSGERAVYAAISPCRLLDTRLNSQVGPRGAALASGETATISARGAQGECTAADLPADAIALAFNVTAVGATELTFLTFWPDGDRPEASSLNPAPGQPPAPNAVTTRLSDTGSFRIFNNAGTVHLIIDVVGIYTDHGHTDLHYTKAEADERFLQPEPDSVVALLTAAVPEEGQWVASSAGWRHDGGGEACLLVPIDAPAGRTVTDVSLRYSHRGGAAATASVRMTSLDTTPGPATEFNLKRHVVRADIALALTGDDIVEVSVTNDAASVPVWPVSPTLADGTTAVELCADEGVRLHALRANFAPRD